MKFYLSAIKNRLVLTAFMVIFLNSFHTQGQTTLKGLILDEQTGEPVVAAVVKVANSFIQSESDAGGQFILHSLKNEKLTLYIYHISYDKDTVTVSLPSENIRIQLKPHTYISQEITVSATRADKNSAFPHNIIAKSELENINTGRDIPYLLQMNPSLIATSDAGNGIGYSGLRLRGSDATRINVTINGVPVNDAESHQVYWVDLPDLASSTENIQIQRGLGTSSNGSGAFGGSVNIQTLQFNKDPYASISSSAGSFNSFKNSVGFGSGLISNHFSLDGKISMIRSDGYIDRAQSDLRSFFLSGSYIGKNSSLKLLIMSGKENTYQSWYGVPEDSLKSKRTFNPAGMYYDANGEIKFYDDQVDNYQQDYYQLHYTRALSANWNFNVTLHGTLGKGYYEEYSSGDAFSKYGLQDLISGSDTIAYSDFIRQRWLRNEFYGAILTSSYQKKNLKLTIGAATNIYTGDHFGELLWSKDQVINSPSLRYYQDDAEKKELNVYSKLALKVFSQLEALLDLQVRTISYDFDGRQVGGSFSPSSADYTFFNPKLGLSYSMPKDQRVYLSVGMGSKEPVRDDFINSSLNSRPKFEQLIDYEAGYQLHKKNYRVGLNFYFMDYRDQLILNGKINDVGEYTRQNVESSFRKGIELELAYLFSSSIRFEGNLSLSQNKIKDFMEYIDDYDSGLQNLRHFQSTDIAFSPSLIAYGLLSWNPVKALNIDLSGKYVGKQFLDNTESDSRSIDAYLINDLQFRYSPGLRSIKLVSLSFQINNVLDIKYSSNGYTYSYVYGGDLSTFNYYFPQAGRNFMAGINLRF